MYCYVHCIVYLVYILHLYLGHIFNSSFEHQNKSLLLLVLMSSFTIFQQSHSIFIQRSFITVLTLFSTSDAYATVTLNNKVDLVDPRAGCSIREGIKNGCSSPWQAVNFCERVHYLLEHN